MDHSVSRLCVIGASFAMFLLGSHEGRAEDEKKSDAAPRITAISPLELVRGESATLRIRGLQLDASTEVRVADAPGVIVELREQKKADVPNGLEAKKVGDTQAEVTLKLPPELEAGTLRICLVTPAGETNWQEIRIVQPVDLMEEKEPDNGFREAQSLVKGKILRGAIKEEKDVDVFRVDGRRGERVQIEVFAARGGSLMDPTITLFDAQGRLLTNCDDEGSEGRDARLEAVFPSDGAYFISIADANDRGSGWHSYSLQVREVQP